MTVAFMNQLNAAADLIVTAGWNHFLQTVLLAGLLGVIDATIGRRLGAHWRCALWLLFFAKLALPPHVALPSSPAYWWRGRPFVSQDVIAPPPTPMPMAMPKAVQSWSSPNREGATTPIVASRADASTRVPPSWRLAVVSLWAVGVVTLAAGTFRQRQRVAAVLRASRPADSTQRQALERCCRSCGVRRLVNLRIADAALGPMVLGLSRPTIYLPAVLTEALSPAQLHAVLVHELMHIKRGDLWVTALQTIARVLFFHQPAVWWVNAHLSRLREEATDRAVLAHADIDAQAYSLALVAAAEVARPTGAFPSFALGVIETKSQLRKRILMNLSHPRARHAHLGRFGLISLALLGVILVPMAPGEATPAPAPTPAQFKAIPADNVVHDVDTTVQRIFAAFNRRDRDAYVDAFTADALILPPGTPMYRGRIGAGEGYLQAPRSLQYEAIHWRDRQFHRIGPWIVETGLVDFQFRVGAEGQVMTDPRQALTVWNTEKDGTLRVKLLSWNPLPEPYRGAGSKTPQAFAFASPVAPFVPNGEFAPVLQAEETFHRAFEEKDPTKAAGFYAEHAILLHPEAGPLRGRPAIQRVLEATPSDRAVHIERQVAYVEGNDTQVLVVNLFRWTFTPAGGDQPVSIAGKGVHLWVRDADSNWKILFDLPNPSQPTAG